MFLVFTVNDYTHVKMFYLYSEFIIIHLISMGGEAKTYTVARCNIVNRESCCSNLEACTLDGVPCFSAVAAPNCCAVARQAFSCQLSIQIQYVRKN